ncbi:hypothetical protein [Mesorhizobium amorphae]
MDQFLDVGNALQGAGPQAKGRLLSLPISPASVTIGEVNFEGEELGILQIRSADGREVNLALDEGQAEFMIRAATQLQALLNKTIQ